nr:hypothetical protein [Wolbachia endosymbiont of Litomosoides brasiliensis]
MHSITAVAEICCISRIALTAWISTKIWKRGKIVYSPNFVEKLD